MTPPSNPRWDQIFIQRHIWRPEHNSFTLPVGGYLLAVGVTLYEASGEDFYNPDQKSYYRGTFHLGSLGEQPNDPPVAVINWEYQLNQCGVAFDPPRADMNTKMAHVLRRVLPTRTTATLLITSVHLGFQ
jgi:hypothetical protein